MQEALRKFKAEIFQALAHPKRIAIVEMLREGEIPASLIFDRLGLDKANVSQHLAVLRAKQIVVSRKEGTQVFYTIRDPLLIEVLDIMKRYFESHFNDALAMLYALNAEHVQETLPELPDAADSDREAGAVEESSLREAGAR